MSVALRQHLKELVKSLLRRQTETNLEVEKCEVHLASRVSKQDISRLKLCHCQRRSTHGKTGFEAKPTHTQKSYRLVTLLET